MNQISVLMTYPMFTNLEKLLEKHYNLIRLWELKDHEQEHFLKANADTIKAVVACAEAGINKKMINLLPRLEIVSTFSVGYDKIDLIKCRERGIKVTNTPDVVTEDVADLAIALALSTLRKICGADGFVRKGLWKMGDFCISTKVLILLTNLHCVGCFVFLFIFLSLVSRLNCWGDNVKQTELISRG